MDADSTARINQAVDRFLERAVGAAAPYTVLRDYLKELAHAGQLAPDEVKAVEEAALVALKAQGQ